MKSDTWIGKKDFRYWYYRFRDSEYYSFTMIGLTFVVSLLLLFYAIIPEFEQWFSIRREVIASQKRITVLQNNINFMNNLDKGILNNQLQTASQALPPDKNFGSMLQSISNAALVSGISLSDYSFQVGNIASTSGGLTIGAEKGLSMLQVSVVVNGSISEIRRFIQALENSLPIAYVQSIDGSGQSASITIQFYQKPFPVLDISGDTPLAGLSAENSNLLQKLSSWKAALGTQNSSQPTSSGSGIPLF